MERSSDNKTASEVLEAVLDAYFYRLDETQRVPQTSQEICDNLRGTIGASVTDVTKYMMRKGYKLVRQDDRLVWKI